MKKIVTGLLIAGFLGLGPTGFAQEVKSESSASSNSIAVGKKSKAKKLKRKKKKLKKKAKLKSKKKKRGLASIENDSQLEVVVFSEETQFEDLLQKNEDLGRNLASQESLARVIGVRREIGLSDKDFSPLNIVLNGGTSTGIEKGQILKVFRKLPVIDPYRENKQTEVEIEFGNLKVMHAEKETAIARVEAIEPSQVGLYVGLRSVLVGDFVR